MAGGAFPIVPSDANNLNGVTNGGIYVGGAGNITLQPAQGGAAITLTAVPVGTIIPVAANKVFATGTSATNLVGFLQR